LLGLARLLGAGMACYSNFAHRGCTPSAERDYPTSCSLAVCNLHSLLPDAADHGRHKKECISCLPANYLLVLTSNILRSKHDCCCANRLRAMLLRLNAFVMPVFRLNLSWPMR